MKYNLFEVKRMMNVNLIQFFYMLIIYYQYLLLLMPQYLYHILIKRGELINNLQLRMILLYFPLKRKRLSKKLS